PSLLDPVAEEQMALAIDIVRSIRNARAEAGVPAARWVEAIVVAGSDARWLGDQTELLSVLARARPLRVVHDLPQKPSQAISLVVGPVEVYLPLAGLVDLAEERRRLRSELAQAEGEVLRLGTKLSNLEFRTKAKPEVVSKEEERLASGQEKARKLRERLETMAAGSD
ncbi:MAG: valine--tRNA ligase, partial [Dehalococcoidia bacterium]|nr:valine--tRNA ligase [Dehalococcoidia bacterium]